MKRTAPFTVAALIALAACSGPSPSSSEAPSTPGTTGAWSGPVRTDLGQAFEPYASAADLGLLAGDGGSWTDPADAAMGIVDLTRVLFSDSVNAGHWNIGLGDWPPPATGSDDADLVIAHGIVLDTTGDGVADYEVGVDDSAPQPGDFRAWVTNLATGVTSEQTGPPYGFPVEFGHHEAYVIQANGEPQEMPAEVIFTFLSGTEPADFDPESLRWYAWASVTEAGEVVAWDYAPDAAWLGFASAGPSGL